MREIVHTFSKGFAAGIANKFERPLNAESLSDCLNAIPWEGGVEVRPLISNPFGSQLQNKLPAIIHTGCGTFLITNTAISYVENFNSYKQLVTGNFQDVPHIADFGDYFLASFSNGVYSITKDSAMRFGEYKNFKTCVNYNGQAIVANGHIGFYSGFTNATDSVVSPNITPVTGTSMIAWSMISDFSFNMDFSNECGFMHVPEIGSIESLQVMGDKILAYGKDGILVMTPYDKDTRGYSRSIYSYIGILSRDCVDGDAVAHVFIGTDMNLYKIVPQRALSDQGYAPVKLGYRYLIEKLINPRIIYVKNLVQWWICGDNACYILTQQGLGRCSETFSNIVAINGNLFGIGKSVDDDVIRIVTGTIQPGSMGIKLFTTIDMDIETSDEVAQCWMYTKYNYAKDFIRTPTKPVGPRSSVFPMVSGTQIRVAVELPIIEQFRLSSIRLRYKVTDRQAIRGTLAGVNESAET